MDAEGKALRCSRHARSRRQQRGIRSTTLEAVERFFDMEQPVGDGCEALQLSRRAVGHLRRELGVVVAERARRIVLIVASDGAVVTIMHDHSARPERPKGRKPERRTSRRSWLRSIDEAQPV